MKTGQPYRTEALRKRLKRTSIVHELTGLLCGAYREFSRRSGGHACFQAMNLRLCMWLGDG